MKGLLKTAPITLLISGMFALGACQTNTNTETTDIDSTAADTSMMQQMQPEAVATLQPLNGSNVQGTVTFTQQDSLVRVVANITGLEPGEHGIHIHENGDCSANGDAAGGHWAGAGTKHGSPNDEMPNRHEGDLGNIQADQSGNADLELTDNVIRFDSLAGHAVIIHQGRDDLQSQPSGDAGARVACGVIQMSNESGMGMDSTGVGEMGSAGGDTSTATY